jgi:capsular exopolysaccharide synthesis family protein
VEPLEYLRTFRRRWAIIAAAVAVAATTAWFTTQTVAAPAAPPPRQYQATAFLWSPPGATSTPPITLQAMVRLATLPDVLVLAAQELDWKGSPQELRSRVQVQVDPQGEAFLDITGVASTRAESEAIASAFSSALIEYLQTIQTKQVREQSQTVRNQLEAAKRQQPVDQERVASLEQALSDLLVRERTPVGLTVLQAPEAEPMPPSTGFEPPQSRTVRLLIAAAIGLLAGLGLALVLERFDTRIRTRQAAEQHFGAPVLAEVPVLRRGQRRGVTVAHRPTEPPADAFRLLAAGVAKGPGNGASGSSDVSGSDEGRSHQGKAILVTSPGPSDGKTTIAANLAAALGEMGRRVLLVSCDLRRPAIHRAFDVPISPGLTDALNANGSSRGVSPVRTRVRNVAVLPSGVVDGSPGHLLASPAMSKLLRDARRHADIVVVDTSPLLVGNDATALLTESDAVVVVARANRTKAELAERAKDVLERLQVPVVGVALNCAREIGLPGSYRRYYRPPWGR